MSIIGSEESAASTRTFIWLKPNEYFISSMINSSATRNPLLGNPMTYNLLISFAQMVPMICILYSGWATITTRTIMKKYISVIELALFAL